MVLSINKHLRRSAFHVGRVMTYPNDVDTRFMTSANASERNVHSREYAEITNLQF